MDTKMAAQEEKHQNGTKLTYRHLLKQWSEQATQKLPNKGPQTVNNTYNIPHKTQWHRKLWNVWETQKKHVFSFLFLQANWSKSKQTYGIICHYLYYISSNIRKLSLTLDTDSLSSQFYSTKFREFNLFIFSVSQPSIFRKSSLSIGFYGI